MGGRGLSGQLRRPSTAGPLFSFAAYLGALAAWAHPLAGAARTAGIYLPSRMLISWRCRWRRELRHAAVRTPPSSASTLRSSDCRRGVYNPVGERRALGRGWGLVFAGFTPSRSYARRPGWSCCDRRAGRPSPARVRLRGASGAAGKPTVAQCRWPRHEAHARSLTSAASADTPPMMAPARRWRQQPAHFGRTRRSTAEAYMRRPMRSASPVPGRGPQPSAPRASGSDAAAGAAAVDGDRQLRRRPRSGAAAAARLGPKLPQATAPSRTARATAPGGRRGGWVQRQQRTQGAPIRLMIPSARRKARSPGDVLAAGPAGGELRGEQRDRGGDTAARGLR